MIQQNFFQIYIYYKILDILAKRSFRVLTTFIVVLLIRNNYTIIN